MNLTLTERAANYTAVFPKYPPMMAANGWLYGLWYCGTSFQKARLYGQYPGNYLKRVLSLFPDAERILQPCAGTITGPGTTLDMSAEFGPDVIGDVQDMPFDDCSFDLVIIDPPYGKVHAEKYGIPMLGYRKTLKEIRRVLEPNGYMVWLDNKYPSYKRTNWHLIGLIGVVTGFMRMARLCSIFQKPEDLQSGQGELGL